MKTFISLGAGVQSSTVYLMSCLGHLPKADFAVFADTGNEPSYIYDYLKYLATIGENYGVPIMQTTAGNLGEDGLIEIPAFFKTERGRAMLQRHCTTQFKINPLDVAFRRLANLDKWQRAETPVQIMIGISTDEASRMKVSKAKWKEYLHPLIDLKMSRYDCLNWMEKNGFRKPRKSSCVFCPYHSDQFWHELKHLSPADFEEACRYDEKIRTMKRKAVNNLNVEKHAELYLHRSLRPLREIEFDSDNQRSLFEDECEGICGV